MPLLHTLILNQVKCKKPELLWSSFCLTVTIIQINIDKRIKVSLKQTWNILDWMKALHNKYEFEHTWLCEVTSPSNIETFYCHVLTSLG